MWRKERRKEERYQGNQEPQSNMVYCQLSCHHSSFLSLVLSDSQFWKEQTSSSFTPCSKTSSSLLFPLSWTVYFSNQYLPFTATFLPSLLRYGSHKNKLLCSQDSLALKSIPSSLKTGDLYSVFIMIIHHIMKDEQPSQIQERLHSQR